MNANSTMEVFQKMFSSSQEYPSHKCNVTALEMSGYSGFQKDYVSFIYYGWDFKVTKKLNSVSEISKNCWGFCTHSLLLYAFFFPEVIISVGICFAGALGFILF